MNNILVDNINLLELDNYTFDKDSEIVIEEDNINKKVNIEILPNIKVKLTLIGKNNNLDLFFKLNKNSSLELNTFIMDGSVNINSKLYSYSRFILNNSILNSKDSKNHIIVKHIESNSISNIKNHGFSKNKAKLIFDIEGIIDKKASKCECNQDNQIIENENSLSSILPKLLIDNYDVIANHSAYVGEFKEKDLFYLTSRGISLSDSKFLLLNAFLLGYLDIDDNLKSKLKNSVLKYIGKEV